MDLEYGDLIQVKYVGFHKGQVRVFWQTCTYLGENEVGVSVMHIGGEKELVPMGQDRLREFKTQR